MKFIVATLVTFGLAYSFPARAVAPHVSSEFEGPNQSLPSAPNGDTSAPAHAQVSYVFTEFNEPNQAPPSELNGGTSAWGINNRGEIVGNYGVANQFLPNDPTTHIVDGFSFAHNTFTDVAIAGATFTELIGVNDYGVSVGDYFDADGNSFDFVRNRGGQIHILPPVSIGAIIPGESIGINNTETIVGTYTLDPNFATLTGFILKNGQYTSFNYPGALRTSLQGVNDRGIIVGRQQDTLGNWHGFLLNKNGSLTAIDVPGAIKTYAWGINNRDQVVGYYRGADDVAHGFVFSKGVYTTLDFPDAIDTQAFSINDRGVIVGTFNGYTAGFIATPARSGN